MLITWSRFAPSPIGAQKASMESYSPAASSWKERRRSMAAVTSEGFAVSEKPALPAPKKRVLHPAT
jgi:hypothetical protein